MHNVILIRHSIEQLNDIDQLRQSLGAVLHRLKLKRVDMDLIEFRLTNEYVKLVMWWKMSFMLLCYVMFLMTFVFSLWYRSVNFNLDFKNLPLQEQFTQNMSNPLYYKILSKAMHSILNRKHVNMYCLITYRPF